MNNDDAGLAQKQPEALYMLSAVQMWERMSYYGMRALLSLFLISRVIGYSKSKAAMVYAVATALVYLTPVFGGYAADRYLGKRKSMLIGALCITAGMFMMAAYEMINPGLSLYGGLALVILGNGFFKPCITTIVGDLYHKNDSRRDMGFSILYMAINVGALLAPFVCGFFGQGFAWKYGFAAAGVIMILGTITYLATENKYLGDLGKKTVAEKQHRKTETVYHSPLTVEEKNKIKAILVFTFFAVFFFAFFEQAGSSLTFFADEATRLPLLNIFGWHVQTESSFFQAVNPVFVVLLAPLFSILWLKLGKKEPSIPGKFGWGLFAQGVGFIIMVYAAGAFLKTGPVSWIWLTLVYLFCTIGELCLSPIGNSMVTKLAPAKYMSMLMGIWLASSLGGSLLAGWLASYYEAWKLTTLFTVPAVLSIVFAAAIWIMSPSINKWMYGVK